MLTNKYGCCNKGFLIGKSCLKDVDLSMII